METSQIVLDPTLVLRQRGIQWMQRTSRFESANILVSGTLLDKSWNGDVDGLMCFESSAGLWRSSNPRLLHGLSIPPLPIKRIDTNYFSRTESTVCARIVGETFNGLLDGGILAARRLVTMQLLMQKYGVEVRLRDAQDRGLLESKIQHSLGAELSSALLRRCRFLGEAYVDGSQAIMTVIDGGENCAR